MPPTPTLVPMNRTKAKKLGGKPTLPRDEADRVLEHLIELRKRFDSDPAMAAALGVSQPTVSNWLQGKSSPSTIQLDAIARHFAITEYEMRKGVDRAQQSSLDVALRYHGEETWPESAIRQARELQKQGTRMSAQKWADRLTVLANGSTRR